jgi:hypothetical protein
MRTPLGLVFVTFLALACASSAFALEEKPEKSSNIRVNPLGLMFGVANATWDIGAAERFTIGPSAAFTTRTSNGVTATGYGFGVDTNFFLGHDRFTDSWIFSPFIGYAHASSSNGSASGSSLGANIQYGWFYDSGFNIGLGGGIQYISIDYSSLGLGTASGLLPSITFTLGYAF